MGRRGYIDNTQSVNCLSHLHFISMSGWGYIDFIERANIGRRKCVWKEVATRCTKEMTEEEEGESVE